MTNPSEMLILFADLQDDIVKRAQTNDEKTIRKTARALAQVAAALHIETLATVVQTGPKEPEVIDDVTKELPALKAVPRTGPRFFASVPSKEAVVSSGKRTLVIAGVATEIVVLHAALGARSLGLNVQVLLDAGGGFSERTENAAIRQMEAQGVVTSSLASFATSLVDDFTKPDGAAVISALRSTWS